MKETERKNKKKYLQCQFPPISETGIPCLDLNEPIIRRSSMEDEQQKFERTTGTQAGRWQVTLE